MKAIFFDLDGTICNTLADIRFHVNQMLRSRGYPEISEQQTKAFVGDGAKKLIERSLPADAEDAEGCFEQFLESFSHSDGALLSLYDGEREALSAWKDEGWRLAVITNKPQEATRRTLAKFFPEDFFDFVGGDSGMFPVKPDPSLTRYAALSLRVSPKDCVFVGDGEQDVRTAKSAGMRGIAALWGYRTKQQLAAAGATEFAENFSELRKIL